MFNIPFLTGERYRVWFGTRDIMDWLLTSFSIYFYLYLLGIGYG